MHSYLRHFVELSQTDFDGVEVFSGECECGESSPDDVVSLIPAETKAFVPLTRAREFVQDQYVR